MTNVVPGTGGPRQSDTRFSPSHCAVWTLLGRSRSGAWSDDKSGWQHLHTGNAERPCCRSAALAGVGFNGHSRTNDVQNGLEIDGRAGKI